MNVHIPFLNATIHARLQGSGPETIVLLHGYLESVEIWNGFADLLSKECRVLMIDIPGHGQSGVVAPEHSMNLMAGAVREVLDFMDIPSCYLAGHSMGGYVALACLANFPERIKGLCLLHSTPFADTEEKKKNRDREIDLIREGKLPVICSINIPNGFASDNLSRMKDEVERAIHIATQSSPLGTIALLEGLKTRPDQQELFFSATLPILVVLGRKDNYISYETFESKARQTRNGQLITLENSGHQSFLEEPGATANALLNWMYD